MEHRKQLIALRLNKELLQILDAYAKIYKNGNRSQVISTLLENVLTCANDHTLKELVTAYDAYSSGYICQFKRPQNM